MIYAVVGAVVFVVLLVVLTYNGLVRRRNRTQEAWSQIDVQLKRRHDLIPNLVETVQGYATHERQTFEAVTQARAGAVNASQSGDPNQMAPAENILTQTLKRLFAVAEAYPELKAAAGFLQLQEQLVATEDKIGFARQYYNTSVRDYDTAIQTFPRNMLASLFGFRPAPYFQADEDDRSVSQVGFSS